MDDFIARAAFAGMAVALAAGPLGSFLVWRRMAYFGDALTHSALLGVALGLAIGIGVSPAVIAICTAMAMLLVLFQRQRSLADDTLLGILSHGALSLGIIALTLLEGVRYDLLALLVGDILVVSSEELTWIWIVALGALGVLAVLWRSLLRLTVQEDLARVEGVPVVAIRLAFMVLLAAIVAVAMKITGVLLVTALLIIPAAAARRYARSPEQMAAGAAVAGCIAVMAGLAGSVAWDAPSGPSIVVAALALFLLSLVMPPSGKKKKSS